MASKVEECAAQFEANNAEYIEVVSSCSDEEWRRVGPSDERPVAVITHHLATVQGGLGRLIGSVAAGRPIRAPRFLEEIDQINADHARHSAGISREEVPDALRTGGRRCLRGPGALAQ